MYWYAFSGMEKGREAGAAQIPAKRAVIPGLSCLFPGNTHSEKPYAACAKPAFPQFPQPYYYY